MGSPLFLLPRRFPRLGLRTLGLACALFLAGCGGGGGGGGTHVGETPGTPNPNPSPIHPKIHEVLPAAAVANARIEIRGIGLNSTSKVTLGGRDTFFVKWDDTKVVTWVPENATSGVIELETPLGVATFKGFTVTATPPRLFFFSPKAGAVHSEVRLYGSLLDSVKRVTVGGVDAPIVEAKPNRISITVPPGAQTGKIEVIADTGQDSFQDEFTVRAGAQVPPELTQFDPPKGPPGTKVTLSGKGLADVVAVGFNGMAAPHETHSDTRITAVVPAGSSSGPITVQTHLGKTGRSQLDFTVTNVNLPAPVIQSFTPESGPGDTRVEIKGSGFDGVDKAFIGNQKVFHYKWNDTKLVIWTPKEGAVSGPITLSSQAGTGHSKTPFKVTRGTPAITDFLPAVGRPGIPVLIRGKRFNDLESVQFGDGMAAAPLKASPTEIKVLVPPGATTGPIRVRTQGGIDTSSSPFTVSPGSFASRTSLRIESAYITQAVQRMDGTVPLVAGRDGMLRVFLQANTDNGATPAVRATILDASGNSVFTQDILAPQPGVPTEVREEVFEDSWNLPIPGSALQPGNALLLELMAQADASVDIPVRTYPADGKARPMDIRPVPPLRITLFPVRSGGIDGNVDRNGRTAEDWLTRIRQFYPVKDVEVKVGPIFTSPKPLLADFSGYYELREALEAKRLLQDSGNLSYWYGVFRLPVDSNTTGLGMFGIPKSNRKRSAIGWDDAGDPDGQNCFGTFAHELGHTFDRMHAPCDTGDTADLNFKHAGGTIGVFGLDVPAKQIKDPDTYRDVMGYCYPRWVSDYTYEAVMAFRNWELNASAAHGAAGGDDETASLLVWGTIDEGKVTFRPSFTSPQPPAPPEPGPYTLECRDVHGRPLMHPIAFAADTIPDLPTRRDFRSFLFLIPMTQAMLHTPFTMHVLKGGHRLQEAGGFPAGSHRASAPRDPVARPWGAGVVHLGWDHGAYPSVVVKDPHTREILAIASGGSVEVETEATELECVFSISPTATGERSVVRMVRVAP